MLTKAFISSIEKVFSFLQSQCWSVITKLAKTGFQLAQQNLGKEPLRVFCTALTKSNQKSTHENSYPEPFSGTPGRAHVNCTIKLEINRLHFCSTTSGMPSMHLIRPVAQEHTQQALTDFQAMFNWLFTSFCFCFEFNIFNNRFGLGRR